jgi:predicted Zn-dependent protease
LAFGGRYCDHPGGQAALNKLAAQLSPKAGGLNIRVADIGFVNAAALPGGNIVIFEQLLRHSNGPDEVAGVLAHEIAHVEERHVTQALLRELGMGIFIAAFGGTTGASVNDLMAASYSRDSEREADAGAITALRRAGISPLPTADFFGRMARKEGKLSERLSYISSHPVTRERQRRFAASADELRTYRPSLSRDEWEALVNICRNDQSPA